MKAGSPAAEKELFKRVERGNGLLLRDIYTYRAIGRARNDSKRVKTDPRQVRQDTIVVRHQ
jgi:hypothetical protein